MPFVCVCASVRECVSHKDKYISNSTQRKQANTDRKGWNASISVELVYITIYDGPHEHERLQRKAKSVQCKIYSVQRTAYSVQRTAYSVLASLQTMQHDLERA